MADKHERALILVRELRALGGVRKRRARLPRMQQPDRVREDYARAIRAWLLKARNMAEHEVFGEVRRVLEANERARSDAGGSLTERMERMSRRYFDESMTPTKVVELSQHYAKRTSDFQRDQFAQQTNAAFGVSMKMLEPDLRARTQSFVEQNVSLIRSVPRDYFADVERTVFKGVREGQRWESVAKDLEARLGVAESRAQLIARDQAGKFFGEVNKARQEGLGLSKYIWRTANDERVRDDHAEREGVTFEWDDPPEDGHPGEPIQCRCYAEPDFSDLLA